MVHGSDLALEVGLLEADELSLVALVEAQTPGDARLAMCIQCGTCGGSCPSGPDMEHRRHKLFAWEGRAKGVFFLAGSDL